MLGLLISCALAGSVGGLLQGMIGVGTGIIVIPLLTLLLPIYGISNALAIHVALATSMAAIVLTSISAGIGHHQHKNVRWDIFKKIIVSSIIGSGIGAMIASYMPARILEIIFAIFMFYVAWKLLKGKKVSTQINPILSSTKNLSLGGLVIGISASIVGIGGGLFMVPFLRSRHLEMRYAVGTSTWVGLPVAAIGALTYIITGLSRTQHQSMMLGYMHWPAFLAISVTGIIFALIGAKLSKSMNPLILQRIFAICIICVGVKMLF